MAKGNIWSLLEVLKQLGLDAELFHVYEHGVFVDRAIKFSHGGKVYEVTLFDNPQG
jgi:hypothetical protein